MGGAIVARQGASKREQVLEYLVEKVSAYLAADTEAERYRWLIHIVQLSSALSGDVLRRIIEEGRASDYYAVKLELCALPYFAANEAIMLLLRDFENDPDWRVRSAYEETQRRVNDILRGTGTCGAPGLRMELLQEASLCAAVKEVFRSWVAAHPAPDEERFLVGGHPLSARELLREVERESPVGVLHVKMLTKWLIKQEDESGGRGRGEGDNRPN